MKTQPTKLTIGERVMKSHLVLEPDASGIRALVADMCPGYRQPIKYPGPSPVSIERASLSRLRNEYLVCEKTDGMRAALLCVRYNGLKIVALLDRKMDVYLFSLRKVPRALFQGTLLDCELAWDKVEDDLVLLVFDAVVVSGVHVGHTDLYRRLAAARNGLTEYSRDPADPARVAIKGFVPLTARILAEQHLEDAARRYDIDGIILTPAREPVKFGRHMTLFKLKTKHTVDFLLGRRSELCVYDPATGTHVAVGTLARGKAPEGSIVECRHLGGGDPAVRQWALVAVRTDKNTANDRVTFDKTMLNERENISMHELYDARLV